MIRKISGMATFLIKLNSIERPDQMGRFGILPTVKALSEPDHCQNRVSRKCVKIVIIFLNPQVEYGDEMQQIGFAFTESFLFKKFYSPFNSFSVLSDRYTFSDTIIPFLP